MDLISREAALEKAGWVNLYGGNKSAHVVFSRDIHQLPAVDAVEVVRCLMCKHFEKGEACLGWCALLDVTKDECGYCDEGETEGRK